MAETDDTRRLETKEDGVASASDRLLSELRERLVHIEDKVDALRADGHGGHADQVFGARTFAQSGEDLAILNVFHLLGIRRPTYVDIGAHHPFNISNTALLYERGSRGINVEANPTLLPPFHRHRPEDLNLNLGVGPKSGTAPFYFIDDWSGRNTFSKQVAEEFVRDNPGFSIQRVEDIPVTTLNDIVDRYNAGRFPDLLSIDAEGLDVEILRSTTFGDAPPTVVCVEAGSGSDTDPTASLSALMHAMHYELYVRTVSNRLFVRKDAARRLRLD